MSMHTGSHLTIYPGWAMPHANKGGQNMDEFVRHQRPCCHYISLYQVTALLFSIFVLVNQTTVAFYVLSKFSCSLFVQGFDDDTVYLQFLDFLKELKTILIIIEQNIDIFLILWSRIYNSLIYIAEFQELSSSLSIVYGK